MRRRTRTSGVGTALARFNALRHGITSSATATAPQGGIEAMLAGRIATLSWQLRRVARYECSAVAIGRARLEPPLPFREGGRGIRSPAKHKNCETNPSPDSNRAT